jgi:cell division septation protein DedD
MSQSGHQLELFSDPQEDPKRAANRAQRNSFVARIWGYEKTVLIAILLLVTGIVSFSLGVERSRRTQINQPAAIVNEPVVVEAPKKVESLNPPVAVKPVAVKQEGQYTIQVASFKASSYAKKEAELLNKRGLKALTFNKGKFIILCVGNFPNKEEAQPLLSELRKYYKSCYIRRL